VNNAVNRFDCYNDFTKGDTINACN
jgi:hypothetical protein